MNSFDWREELRSFQDQIESSVLKVTQRDILRDPIGKIVKEDLCVLSTEFLLRRAAQKFLSDDIDYALIQDTPDTIHGVLRRDAVHAAMVSAGQRYDHMVVADVMDRNVCIEPENATISEVMNRMTYGGCLCTVVVSRSGRPLTIISPRTILDAMSEFFPEEVGDAASRFQEAVGRAV